MNETIAFTTAEDGSSANATCHPSGDNTCYPSAETLSASISGGRTLSQAGARG
jgi:hypothetical protein